MFTFSKSALSFPLKFCAGFRAKIGRWRDSGEKRDRFRIYPSPSQPPYTLDMLNVNTLLEKAWFINAILYTAARIFHLERGIITLERSYRPIFTKPLK